MAPRASWTGYLKLSLVSVPVKAYSASQSSGSEIRLHQLHRGCHQRIRQQRVCPRHGPVEQQEIVSGYEFAPDQYVVLEPEELKSLKADKDSSIQVDAFIGSAAVDPVYQTGRTFYLVPDGPVGQRAYALLHRSLQVEGMHGVARTVLAGKEQVVLLRPCGRLLALTVLAHAERVKTPAAFEDELAEIEFGDREKVLAQQLLQSLFREEFDLGEYGDSYTERLSELIEAKIDGREPAVPEKPEEEPQELLQALEESLRRAGSTSSASAEPNEAGPGPKMAPSARQRDAEDAERTKKSG